MYMYMYVYIYTHFCILTYTHICSNLYTHIVSHVPDVPCTRCAKCRASRTFKCAYFQHLQYEHYVLSTILLMEGAAPRETSTQTTATTFTRQPTKFVNPLITPNTRKPGNNKGNNGNGNSNGSSSNSSNSNNNNNTERKNERHKHNERFEKQRIRQQMKISNIVPSCCKYQIMETASTHMVLALTCCKLHAHERLRDFGCSMLLVVCKSKIAASS